MAVVLGMSFPPSDNELKAAQSALVDCTARERDLGNLLLSWEFFLCEESKTWLFPLWLF